METLTFRRPRIVVLVLLVLVTTGLSALMTVGRQEDPTITNLFAMVKTVFPGADPARVEALVTTEVERVMLEIPEVKTVISTASTGLSIVFAELYEDVPDGRIEQVWSEARDRLSDISRGLPAGALKPEFNEDVEGTYTAIVALEAAHDHVPMTIVGRYAEALKERLRAVPGTRQVDIFGAPEEEVLVTIDTASAARLGLTADLISRAIGAADSKVQAGRVRSDQSDWLINVAGEFTALDRLRRIIVKQNADGRVARLSDMATVTRGPRTPQTEHALQDGRSAILLATQIQAGQQVDVWMDQVRQTLAENRTALPVSVRQSLVFDQSRYASDRLTMLARNMMIGGALICVILFITLGARAAMIVSLTLPVVTLATLATMNLIGLPIHQMSVTGLIVALGLLVDAAIVMTDDVGRRLRSGLSRLESVRLSVRRLFAPLLASMVTTALSFTPMMLLPGAVGDFVGPIAVAVVIMLFWSFIVAIGITPAIAGRLLPHRAGTSWLADGIAGGPVGRLFENSLLLALRNPIRSIILALVLPLLGFASLPILTAQFFPGVDRDQFHIEVEMADGNALARTRAVVREMDTLLRAQPDIHSVSWVVGRSAPAFYYNMVSKRISAPGFAQALVTSASPATTARLVPDLQKQLGDAFPEARILVRGLVQGPPVDAPLELRFVGPETTVLRELGDRARRIVSALDMVTVARTSVNGGAPKVNLHVDETKARILGLDLTGIARQLEAGLEGVTGGSLLEGTEQLPVRVRVGDVVRGDLAAIANFTILPPNAAALAAEGHFPGVPLSALANVRLEPGESTITRRNGERINTVQAFLSEDVLPEEALAAVKVELDRQGFTLPPGYRLEFGGDAGARQATIEQLLGSFGLVITLAVAIMVLTFNSFRLCAVVFAVAGLSAGLSFLCLAIFHYPFGINALIGCIGSIGVSINAAIIILTGLQADKAALAGDRRAMAGVVMAASRHIVSTTVTTFGGFLPLILQGGGFWPPFAVAVAGGVLLSTVVSFYFTPPVFALLYARRERRQNTPAPQTAGPDVKPLRA